MGLDPLFMSIFLHFFFSFFCLWRKKMKKLNWKPKKMILTSKWVATHTFTCQNTQQTYERSTLNIRFSFFRGRLDSRSRDCPCRYEHHHCLSRRHSNLLCVLGRMDVLGLSLHQMSKSKWRRKETAQVTLGFRGGITKATTLLSNLLFAFLQWKILRGWMQIF